MSNFKYIEYNSKNKNTLIDSFKEISKDKNNLIVVENNIEKLYYKSMEINLNDTLSDIISMEDFREKIFLTDRYILRETKRIILFFNALTEEQKLKLNIKNYFDCIDIANNFYNYYKIFFNKKFNIDKNNCSSIQKNQIEIFEDIKVEIDKLLGDKFIPIEWLEKEEFLDFSFFEKYKKIIFFDIVKYDFYFKEIIEKLVKNIDVNFILQMNATDFDEKNFRIINFTPTNTQKNTDVLVYSSELSVISHILKNKNNDQFVSLSDDNSQFTNLPFSIFDEDEHTKFNSSMIFKIIDSLLNINTDFNKYESVDIRTITKYVFCPSVMKFFGLDSEDYKFLNKLINDGYKYLNEEIIEKINAEELNKYLNFEIKMKQIFSISKKINDITNIDNLILFLKDNIFKNDEDIILLYEDYENIFDLFYEILGIIKANEDSSFFKGYNYYFKNNIGQNLILLILKFLSNLNLRKIKKSSSGIKIKPFNLLKLTSNNISPINVLGLDSRSLYKFDNTFSFLNEKQKRDLGICNYDDLKKIEKYRFLQNISAYENINFYVYKNSDENVDVPDLIYIFNNKEDTKNIDYNYLSYVYKNKYYSNTLYDGYEIDYSNKFENENIIKETSDFKGQDLQIGAYDYVNIKNCELKFIYNKIANLEENFDDKNIGFMSKVLGSILHSSMEKLIKKFYKNFIEDINTLNLDITIIRDELLREFKNNYFKIDAFMKKYIEQIVIPKISKNINRFFKETYVELSEQKLLRFYSEKSGNKKNLFIEDAINIILTGRIDLLIECKNLKKIVDFKSGKMDEDQLNFYNFLLFGDDQTTIKSFCNLWDYENKNMKNNDLNFSKEIERILSEMIRSNFYRLADKNSVCALCSFKKICPKEVKKIV